MYGRGCFAGSRGIQMKENVFPSNIIASGSSPINDYFVEKGGQRFAGIHLLIDFWEAKNLANKITVENALRDAAISAEISSLSACFAFLSLSAAAFAFALCFILSNAARLSSVAH